MRKSTRLLAIFLAVLMTVSVLPVSAFAADSVAVGGTITEVDPDNELAWATVFPYNPGSGDAYWSGYVSLVENPTFYTQIPAKVDGVKQLVPVEADWTLVSATDAEGNPITDLKYNGAAVGTTYTFEPKVSDAFTWGCSVKPITVKIVDAGWTYKGARQGFISDGVPVPYVIKWNDSSNGIYDATGRNLISNCAPGDALVAFGGVHNTVTGTGKTAPAASDGKSDVTVTGNANITAVYGGGHGKAHTGGATIKINDATVGTVYSGSYRTTMADTTNIDISGDVTITNIIGGGDNYQGTHSGDMIVTIHDLAESAKITSIMRSRATKLVVRLDNTSTRLLTDSNTTIEEAEIQIKVAEDEYEPYTDIVDESKLTGIDSVVTKGDVLPTTFEGLEGTFVWDKDTSATGEQTFTLTAPTGYFFDGYVKTKEYTITVYNEMVEASAVVIDQGDVTLNTGSTTVLTATVEPDNAIDKTVTWSTQDTDVIEIDAVTGEVKALAVGVATVTATVDTVSGSVSDTCTVTVEQAVKITDVDTEGLALYTVFPYNDVDSQTKWSSYASYVESPVFYPTLSVLIEGQSDYTDLPVTWVCTDENGAEVEYNGKATGSTYYFRAVAEGYTFTGGAPVITAEIADAGLFTQTTRNFGYSSVGNQIPIVVKINDDEDCVLYDATGLNVIAMSDGEAYAIPTMSKSNLYHIYAGLGNKNGTGKTANINPEGDTSITLLDVARLETLYGGGYKVAVDGSTNITIKNSTITTVYGGGNGADVTKDANIDVSGKVNSTSIYGGGLSADVSGVANITIHELEEGFLIGKISKGTASAMVIDVDDPEVAVEIFKAVDDWTNVTAKVNGQEVKVITSLDVAKTEYSVAHGTPLANVGLPTSFEVGGSVVDGFTWDGEYNATRAGTYALTLVPPADVYLTVEIAVTVTVEAKVASYKISSISTPTANVDVVYKTSLEDAKVQLPTEFVANDGEFTVPSSAYEWTTEEYNGIVPGEYTFTAVITNDDYIYLEGVEAFKAVVTVGVPAGEETVVTEIDLPVNYTVFTKDTGTVSIAGKGETRPVKFYDKLNAVAYENGVRKDIEITGIEWDDGVKDRTDTNGEYWIYTIKSYDPGVEIAPELIAATTITAYKTEVEYKSNSSNVKANGTVVVPAVIKLSGYEAYSGGYKGYPGMAAMDATGFNNLYSNITLANNITYYAGNYSDIAADVSLVLDEGIQATGIYGGGYKASVTGDSVVTFKKNATILKNVYAGSFEDFFKGTSTLNFESGSVVNGKVYASSNGGNFDGDVIINVESGAQIAGIAVAPEGEDYPDSVRINVASDFDLSLIEGLETGLVTVYVDGVQRHFVSEVDIGSFRIEVENGAVSDYRDVLPKVSITTTANQTYEVPETDYTWTDENGFDGNKSGEYVFTLKFNDNYSFVNNAQYNNTLVVYVKVDPADYRTVSEITTEIPPSVTVVDGTAIEDVEILSSVSAYTYGVGQTVSDAVLGEINGITWTSSDYNPNVEGNYTFTMVLPDGYVMATPVTVTVTVVEVADPTITAIKVPVTETYFTNGIVTEPKFYSTLEAEVLTDTTPETITLRGITWKCTGTYSATTVGTYEFVIEPSSLDGKYQLRDGLLDETKITVHVVNSTITYGKNSSHYKTTTENLVPIFVQDENGVAALYDLTGCNKIYAGNLSASARLLAGGDDQVATTDGQTARINMSSSTLQLVAGGSFGRAFTGNAEINVYGTAKITDLVAGTVNEAFNGDSHITIDGEVEIDKIVAGSDYRTSATATDIGIVGSENAVAFNGTVTITIKDTFEGSIGSIEKAADKLVINCPATFPYANYVDLTDANVEIYVDGVRAQHVTNVQAPEKVVYNVKLGTAADAVGLPTTLAAMINGVQGTINGVTWICDNYNADKAGKYTFTPVIPAEYSVTTDIEVTVRVLTANAGQATITEFAPISTVMVSLGTQRENVNLPTTVMATVNGQRVAVEVDNWACSNYDGTVFGAEYTFTATVSGEYVLGAAAPTLTVKVGSAKIVEIYVPVTETTFPRGAVETPVFYDTLKVKLDSGMVTEVSGFEWTVKDYNKNSVGTYTATINAAPENCEFAGSLNVPSIKITVTRQQYDVMTTDAYIYLYGIPTVVNGTTSATYLYDMTGCNKTSQTNIVGKTVYGGTPANKASLSTTMIEMRGGKLGAIYGGSRDATRVTQGTYIYVLGGSLSQIYGGGNGSTTSATMAVTKNTYVYVENASVTSRVSGAGYNGNVEEDAMVIVKNSTLNGIYGGSYSKKIGEVEGLATIKLLDGATVGTVYGSGRTPVVNELEVYLSKYAAITSKFDTVGQSDVTEYVKIFFETGFDLSKVYTEEDKVELYEGHFLEDRETFVTDREIKVIRNGGFVRGDFYVEKGTALENIGLPTTVNGEIDGKPETVSGISYSPVGAYDGDTPGRYEFKLNIPDGYNVPPTTLNKAGKVTVVVTEPAQSDYITAIFAENTGFTLANGTAIENVGLPSAYKVVLSAGKQKTIPVKNWKVTDENGRNVEFDSYTAGTYVFTPEFDSAYKVLTSVEMPTHTVTISQYRPYRTGNSRFLNGIPADIGGMMITDKNGNYLGQAGTWTTVYGGSASDDIESTDITMNSGTLYALYGGSSNRDVKGDAKVTVNGGTIPYVYAASVKGTIRSAKVTVNGGDITNVYAGNACTFFKGIEYEMNGGTVTNFYVSDSNAVGSVQGTLQAEDEVLAETTEKDKGSIVVEQGELISIVYVQNGGTVKALYGGGNGASTNNGSVKLYLNKGTADAVSGAGAVAGSCTLGNVYIVMADGFNSNLIYANAPGQIYGKSYVIVPKTFNRYNIIGWDEDGEVSDDNNQEGDMEGEDALDDVIVQAEVIVSGGHYEEGIPVRILYVGGTQMVFGRGIPIRVVGEYEGVGGDDEEEDWDEEDVVGIPTYIEYFDENYDPETETPVYFSYETYVDANGDPLVLTGVWRKHPEQLVTGASAIVYGGGMFGTTDKYPSTYVEFNGGQTKGVYGAGKNDTKGTANLVLDPKGPYSPGSVYGGGSDTGTRANKVHVEVRGGSYGSIYAGGYRASNNGTRVDIEAGSVNYVYMGGYVSATVTAGEVELNLSNCTVGTIYGGGYGDGSTTLGSAYINVNENVNITGNVYPKGVGQRPDGVASGPVKLWAYVNLNDADNMASQKRKIKFTKAQAPYIYVNGEPMAEMPDTSTASFATADKSVEVVTAQASDYRGNRSMVFLNGIPTIIAGDGDGHSYAYQAKTKDGTLNAYQKNADGTFKYENGKRVSNIVRDPDTGMAIKGARLVSVDLVDCIIYGGANGKSVEDVYVEFHNGGGCWEFYAGCRGGNVGYDAQGNEVGLLEVRQFDGGAFDGTYLGNVLGFDPNGNQSVNVFMSRVVFLGINGGTRYTAFGGSGGTIGSEEKFKEGYYNREGEVISYSDPDDGETYTITGTWEDYNLDIEKEDYTEYYDSMNARFNGEDNRDFLEGDYYVDPYDDHYTIYALTAAYSSNHYYLGTVTSERNAVLNRVYGNAYARQTAYGLRYDAELDMFVEDYNNYMPMATFTPAPYIGSNTGIRYNDIRFDRESTYGAFSPLGNLDEGARNLGHTYLNIYETDTTKEQHNEVYKALTVKSADNLTVNRDFYPKWSFTSAWALGVDKEMAQIAIREGYVTGVTDPKDVRIHMLGAEDAARLLNYYYVGSFDEFVTTENATQTRGYQEVFDASDDLGKFVIRHFKILHPGDEGMNRYLTYDASRFGDSQLITFPNGETMLIDTGLSEPATLINNVKYVLEQHKKQGIGDGNTIDYFVITHYHSDHQNNAAPILRAFDIKNFILPPFDKNGVPQSYVGIAETKSEQYVAEGKDPINFIRVKRGDKFIIGEGENAVEMFVTNPGDHSYRTYTLAEGIRRSENGGYSSFANPYSIGFMFTTAQGQKYFTAGDVREDAEVSMLRTYGKDFMKADAMKLSHHGHATSNIWEFMHAVNPDVAVMNAEGLMYAIAVVPRYCAANNTGGYQENVFATGKEGNVKITLDGENVISVTQFQNRAFERTTDEYKNRTSDYEALLDRVDGKLDALTVVADGATAPYGTAYIWNSHANYFDSQFEELSKRYYSGTMSLAMLEYYTSRLTDLLDDIDEATMYGGTDTTTDFDPETPGTDVGGNDTTTPGTQGGIIGDIGGGEAGAGIGGGADVGGIGGGTGGAGDDGETTDPVTPTPDDNRRFIDVAETDWFNKAVNYVADNNYFQGVSENEFDPYGKMTRAMLVTVIGRMAKADTSGAVNNFTDVADGSWYAGYVAWAAENGIVTGIGEGKFAPNDNVTREQIAAILMRYAATKGIETSVDNTEKYDSMKDTDKVSDYAVEALKWATANGIINGAEGNINPKGNATRAEVAQMIMNFCNTFSI